MYSTVLVCVVEENSLHQLAFTGQRLTLMLAERSPLRLRALQGRKAQQTVMQTTPVFTKGRNQQ